MRASFSSERASRSASSRIWRSRSPICAFSSLMRGWLSSSVDDCSASCACNVTRCSFSRRISSELTMSEDSTAPPLFSMSRMNFALASRSAFCERAAARSRLDSPSVWFDSDVLLVPINRLVLERNSSTFASASATFMRSTSISPESHLPGRAGLVAPRRLLQREVAVGDRVRDLGGELRIGRLEFDRDHARLVDRKYGQALVIGFEHALFRRHAQRVFGQPEEAERIADQRDAAQRGVEFRPLAELQFLDHLSRDIARESELHLAGDRLLVDRAVAFARAFLGLGPEEHVLAPLDDDARFGLVFRRDQVDADEGQRRDRDRGPRIHHFLRTSVRPTAPRSSSPSRASFIALRPSLIANSATVRDHAIVHRRLETIKVAAALIVRTGRRFGEGLLTMRSVNRRI